MNIGITSDHRGYKLKQKLTEYLTKKGYNIIDFGPETNDSVDYPDYAFKLCEAISNNNIIYGIAICGSGIGMSIACNKVKGIRCAKVSDSVEAKMTRLDNDSNVVALSSNICLFEAKDIVDNFLLTNFSNEERHIRRIEKIKQYEDEHEC